MDKMHLESSSPVKLRFYVILFFIGLVYLLTLPIDLIDIDSSQYAEIVREMTESNTYHSILDNGRKYLDKPILTFWTIAPFVKLLGVENYAFRLPSILISFLSVFILYKLVFLIWGNERRAWIAALSYLTAPGLYSMVLDPKIDVYLTAYILFTHYFYYMGRRKNPRWFYAMYLSIGLGFITKGPISLVIPAISIGGDILFRRDWKLLGSMKIPAGVFIAAIFPALWSYLLYLEYSSYGPSFFLWIQSFGRFYKDLYNVEFDPFYFYKNFGWAFLTFIFPVFITAIVCMFQFWKKISWKEFFRKVKENEYKNEDFTFVFWLFLFLFLISFSRFQLPQYIYWILPAAAVIFSGIAEKQLFDSEKRGTRFSYLIVGFLYFAFLFVIPYFVFDSFLKLYWIPILALGILFFILSKIPLELALPLSGSIGVFLMVSIYIYPLLVSYQPASDFGAIVQEMEPNKEIIYTYRIPSSKRSYSYYSQRLMRSIYDKNKFLDIVNSEGKRLVIVPEAYYPSFQEFLGKSEYEYKILLSKPSYKVATPKVEFFLKNKREFITPKILLVNVKKI